MDKKIMIVYCQSRIHPECRILVYFPIRFLLKCFCKSFWKVDFNINELWMIVFAVDFWFDFRLIMNVMWQKLFVILAFCLSHQVHVHMWFYCYLHVLCLIVMICWHLLLLLICYLVLELFEINNYVHNEL